jgi:hypothetical protein
MSAINIKDAARRLKAVMPERSICITIAYWCFKGSTEEALIKVNVLPGLDATDCSRTDFKSFSELNQWLDEIINSHSQPANTAVSEQGAGGLRSDDPTRAT